MNPDYYLQRGPGCFDSNGNPLDLSTCNDKRDKDSLKKWCTTEFQPKDQNGAPDSTYIAETDVEKDLHGIAVTKAIIDMTEKKAQISFLRPMTALSPYDSDLVEG